MADQCVDCGAELLPRQRFCRRCGAQVARPLPEEVATKVFQPDAEASAPLLTSPLGATPVTDKVSQQPTAYTPPQSQGAGLAAAAASPSPKRSSWGRFLPLLLIGLVGGGLLVGLLLAQLARRPAKQSANPPAPPPPAAPTRAAVNRPGNSGSAVGVMSEEGALVSDDKTVITRSYPLGDSATVSLTNITGSITVEGWDQPQAEVKVIKEGGSEQDRQAVPIRLDSSRDLLSLETSPTRSSPVEIHYELKLPGHVRAVEIKSADSEVKLSKLTGTIAINVQGSAIELENVSGALQSKIVKGETKATLSQSPGSPQELSSISGDIELRLEGDVNADISAETIDGDINADDDLEPKVEKRPMGQSATVRVGRGGVRISLKTINGDIKIKKQE
jgi:Putative adhesin